MRKKFCSGVVLLLVLLLGLCACIEPEVTDENPTPQPDVNINKELHVYHNTVYVYSTAVNESLLTTDLSPAYLILANKQTALAANYVPSELTVIENPLLTAGDRESGMQLEKTVLQALSAMIGEMRADGVGDIAVTSAYRSYSYQRNLFEKYKNEEMSTISQDAYAFFGADYIYNNYTSQGKTTLDYNDALQVVASYSAAPGTSEHQTGLCVDFVTEEYGDRLDLSFEETAAFDWLQENAYKFGFILRYPKDKVATTGYSYEPWHYRFVGREAATDIHFSGLCLEEYLGQMQS